MNESIGRAEFRSTALFTRRARTNRLVERATFVVFTIGGQRFAAPVERVDRVERPTAAMFAAPAAGGEAAAPVLADIAAPLSVRLGAGDAALRRLLVVTRPLGVCRIPVDAVHEVAVVDATLVFPLSPDDLWYGRAGIRARFERHGSWVYVVDLLRLLSASPDVRR